MFNRSIFTALFACIALALPASAAAAPASSGAVVFSRVVVEKTTPDGPEGKFVEELKGGLFAARNGRLNQLTEDPADSQPAFSSDGRLIAFVRGGDIWAMRADGSAQHALTSGADVDGRPRFAPSGKYVVFERRGPAEGSPRDLYTVNIAAESLHALTRSPEDEHEATFAPDGRTIAFVRSVAETGGGFADDVYSVRPSGARLARLTRSGRIDEFSPRYFSGGIVFSRGQSGEGPGAYADVYTMRRNGTRVKPMVRGVGSAFVEDVTPNGRLLLFRRDQGLWVKPLGPDRAHKLTDVADGSKTNAVFSSDGRKVAAFVATEEAEMLSAIDVATRRETSLAQGFGLETGSVASTIGPVIAWQPVR
jgi:Tol biopolymer transport system component